MKEYELEDVGLFWDFGSLFQNERVGNQQTLFDEGLRASNIWYGSTKSTVWTRPQSSNSCCLRLHIICCRPAQASLVSVAISWQQLGDATSRILCVRVDTDKITRSHVVVQMIADVGRRDEPHVWPSSPDFRWWSSWHMLS